jgi:hypothetical protein
MEDWAVSAVKHEDHLKQESNVFGSKMRWTCTGIRSSDMISPTRSKSHRGLQ